MATQNTINVGVNVTDNGTTNKVVKNVDVLKKKLDETQAVANKGIAMGGTAGVPAGGTSGSRLASQRASTPTPSEMQAYGAGRGAMGATGASARDFANQAQGLGGVVRLYATLAANVFAAGAAFRALSTAIDTANLVQGLDQLGAASGVALGSLSKRLSEVTDGAVSTREAMESVAKASSSGMSSENILRMGKVAKQAAQALGVDMSDAVSRLTRGITKLEPELLDELGIFTKVGTATDDYAKSIGKSASALTDFERRMAFANAVLEEGERKFSAIDFETNPYTKLLATLRDVAQVGLELVNVVFAPIAKFLASSPGALGAVITALGAVLVKQALPALGELRAGLQSSSQQALKTAADFKESFNDAFQSRLEQSFRIPDLEDQLRKAQLQVEKFQFTAKKPKSLEALESGDVSALGRVNKLLEGRQKIIETGMRGSKRASESQIAQAKQEAQYIQAVIQLQEKRNSLENAYQATEQVAGKKQGLLDPEVIAIKRYTELREAADRSTAISNAAQNAQIVGIRRSWTLLNQEIADKGITGIRRYTTLASGGLAAVASRASQVIGAFGQVGMIIAAAGAAFMFIDGLLSSNAKEMSEFGKSADLAAAATENLSRTLKDIDKKPFGEQFSTGSLKAISTAVNEVTASLDSLIDKTVEANKASGIWDRFIDGWKTLWGGDLRSRTANALTQNVFSGLDKLGNTSEARRARQTISKILEIAPEASEKEWNQAFKAIADNEPKLRQIELAMKDLGKASAEAAFNAESFDTALKTGAEAYKAFTSGLKVKDAFTDLGKAVLDSARATQQALKTPEDSIARLASLVDNFEALSLFGTEDQANIIKYGGEITKLNSQYEQQLKAIKDAEKALKDLQARQASLETVDSSTGISIETTASRALTPEIAKARASLEVQRASLQTTRLSIAELAAKFPNVAANQLNKGAELLSTSILASLAKGSNLLQQSVLGVLQGFNVQGVAEARARADSNRLSQEFALTKAQAEIARLQFNNNLQARLVVAEQRLLEEQRAADFKRSARVSQAEKDLADLKEIIAIADKATGKPLEALNAITAAAKSGNAAVLQEYTQLFDFVQQQTGFIVSKQNRADAERNTAFTKGIDLIKEQTTAQQKAIDVELQAKELEIARLNLLEQQVGNLDASTFARRESLKQQVVGLNLQKQQSQSLADIRSLDLAYNTRAVQISETAYKTARGYLVTAKDITAVEKSQLEIQKLIAEEIAKSAKRREEESDKEKARLDSLMASYTARLDAEEAILAARQSAGLVDAEAYRNLKNQLDVRKAQLDFEKQAASIRQEFAPRLAGLTDRETFIERTAQTAPDGLGKQYTEQQLQALAQIREERTRILGLETSSVQNALLQRDTTLQVLAATKEAASWQQQWNDALTSMSSIGETLKTVFGDLGANIATLGTTLLEVFKQQDENTRKQIENQKALAKAETGGNWEAWFDLQDEKDRLRKKSEKDEISGYAKTVGAAKNMFKEKTVANRALAAVERALHLQRLAMDLKEMVQKLFTDGAEVASTVGAEATKTTATSAGFLARTGTYISEIYAKFSAMLGPWGMAAAAAVIAAIFGGSGGKGGATTFVPTAEQRQQTQGTAMGYDDRGNLVQVRRGVFGDTDAKSESIANSLEIIKDNSVKGLDYDDKLLRAFNNLASALDNTARGLYAITGLKSGSLSGIVEGTNTSGGFLGIGGLFSKSVTKSVIDSGLRVTGSFLDLARGVQSTIQTFETVSTTVKKSGFFGIGGSTKTSVSTTFKNLAGLDPKAFESLVSAFAFSADALSEVGRIAGKTTNEITSAMSSISVDQFTSLRGLSGDEFTKELGSLISSLLDDVSLVLFSEFEKFAKFGEGMLETVVRVVDTNRKVLQQLSNTFNTSIDETLSIFGVIPNYQEKVTYALDRSKITTTEVAKATQVLPDQLKSTYTGIFGSFFSNFFGYLTGTVSGTTVAKLEALSQTELAALNAAGVSFATKTVEVVKDGITRSFSEADIRLATIEITNDLAELAGGIENFLDQSNYYLENFLTQAQRAVPVQRAVIRQLENLGYASVDTKAEFKALVESLDLTQPAARRTYQSLMELAPGFIEVLEAVEDQSGKFRDAASGLRDFSKQIREFIDSLKLGSLSTFTPAEKYVEARTQFEQTYVRALSGDKVAMSKVTGAAQTFLESSRSYFASSEAYTNDFNTVLNVLEMAGMGADTAASIAEQQLDALSIHTNLLTSINENISLLVGVPAYATGGYARGLSIVGENGPELVDFTSPGRVYTAEQTQGMFVANNVNQQLVAEVRSLRQEVAKLREQQHTETGHLINATYDAQTRNAEAVTEGIDTSMSRQAWAERTRQGVVLA
jgi:hypothetical protein